MTVGRDFIPGVQSLAVDGRVDLESTFLDSWRFESFCREHWLSSVMWRRDPLGLRPSLSRRPEMKVPKSPTEPPVTVILPEYALVTVEEGVIPGVKMLEFDGPMDVEVTFSNGFNAYMFGFGTYDARMIHPRYRIESDVACEKKPKYSSAAAESMNTIMNPKSYARFLNNHQGCWDFLASLTQLNK